MDLGPRFLVINDNIDVPAGVCTFQNHRENRPNEKSWTVFPALCLGASACDFIEVMSKTALWEGK